MKREVDVLVLFTRNGTMIPQEIWYDEDHAYEINSVKKVEKTGIWTGGRESYTYTCDIGGRTAHLYFGPDRWHVYETD